MSERGNQVPFIQSHASVSLDAMRGLAALLVALEHLRQRLRFAFDPQTLHSPVARGIYVISSFGHASVIIFFVLSGFFVGGSLIRNHRSGKWSWKSYLLHRFVRLWIVLIPALLIGLMWDLLTIHVALHRQNPEAVVSRVSETAAFLSPTIFLGNILFLQERFTPVFGSNGPLWSLHNEFWYYIVFPLGYFAVAKQYRPGTRILCAIACVTLIGVIGNAMLLMPLWVAGVMLYFAPPVHFHKVARSAVILAYPLLFLATRAFSYGHLYLSDYLLSVATCGLIWVLLSFRDRANPDAAVTKISRLLARFSYTLYLIHVPIFTAFSVCFIRQNQWSFSPAHVAIALMLLAGTLGFAWLIASLTEFHTDAVRRQIEVWLQPPITGQQGIAISSHLRQDGGEERAD